MGRRGERRGLERGRGNRPGHPNRDADTTILATPGGISLM